MVHSDRSVVVLLHKHFSSGLPLSLILSALSQIVCAQLCVSLTLQHMSTFHFPFSSQLITSNFSSKLVFLRFCTWIALGDVDLLLSFIMVTKANAVEEATTGTACLYHHHHQSTHVTGGGLLRWLFITVFGRSCCWSSLTPDVSNLTPSYFKIHFNIIFYAVAFLLVVSYS